MPRNVYSQPLWFLPFTSALFVPGPFVPAGFVWVIRQISLVNFKLPYQPLGFFGIGTNNLGFLTLKGDGQSRGGIEFQYSGHWAMQPGDQLWLDASDTAFEGVISGYALTLP